MNEREDYLLVVSNTNKKHGMDAREHACTQSSLMSSIKHSQSLPEPSPFSSDELLTRTRRQHLHEPSDSECGTLAGVCACVRVLI